MRHRLFHAIVLVGAALPGCSDDDASTPAPTVDAAVDTATSDTARVDSGSADAALDSTTDTARDTNEPETCIDGCGDMCLPCIK